MSYFYDEFYDGEYCGECHCELYECECYRRYAGVKHDDDGDEIEICFANELLDDDDDDDGETLEGVPFA